MATKNDTQLTTSATTVQNNTVAASNSATVIGGLLSEIIENKINKDKIDTDNTLAADLDTLIPSQKAVKAYVGTAIKTVKVSLSSAEVLALFTTPKVLVAAPGAGKLILPLRVLIYGHFGTTAYTGNTTLQFAFGTVFSTNFTSALGITADQLATYTLTTNAGTATPAGTINTALSLTTVTGNPSAGDSTFDVYTTYTIVSI